MTVFFAFALAFLVGLAMVSAADPVRGIGPRWAGAVFRASLAMGAGVAVTSMLFFLLRIGGWASAGSLVTLEVLGTALCAWAWWRQRNPLLPERAPQTQRPHWALSCVFAAVTISLIAREIQLALANQAGEWDAMAEWNLRAKYLAGPFDWRSAASPLLAHTHPEYPLLLSAFLARCWRICGVISEGDMTPIVPAVTGLLYFVALVGLVVSGLILLRGVSVGWIGGMVLLSAAPLLQWATAQYADIPLAYCFLAALLLLFLDARGEAGGRWALLWAGFFAGAGAWTKQEGDVFLAALLIAFFAAARIERWRLLLAGAMPGMLLALWFKFWIAPPGDLAPPSIAEVMTRIKDPARYTQIATSFLDRLGAMGAGPGHPLILLAILALLLRREGSRRYVTPVSVSASVLVTMLLSYCAVFVITPRDLSFHLNAWDRLFVQLWPGIVLLFCRLLPGEGFLGTRKATEGSD
jgi:hypothetical protein